MAGRGRKGKEREISERGDEDEEDDDQNIGVTLTKKALKIMMTEVVESAIRRVAPSNRKEQRPDTPKTKKRAAYDAEKQMDRAWERNTFMVRHCDQYWILVTKRESSDLRDELYRTHSVSRNGQTSHCMSRLPLKPLSNMHNQLARDRRESISASTCVLNYHPNGTWKFEISC